MVETLPLLVFFVSLIVVFIIYKLYRYIQYRKEKQANEKSLQEQLIYVNESFS